MDPVASTTAGLVEGLEDRPRGLGAMGRGFPVRRGAGPSWPECGGWRGDPRGALDMGQFPPIP